MRRFATDRPVAFALATTLLLFVAYAAAGVPATVLAAGSAGQQTVEGLARLVAAGLFVLALQQLGGQPGPEITRRGAGPVWLLAIVILGYRIAVHLLAFFGDLGFAVPDPARALAVALNGSAAGVLEEIVFRGLILQGLLLAWGGAARGIARAVLLSSFLFGAAHLVRIVLGQPLPEVGLLALDGFLAGIYYAAFVLRTGSIGPALLIHAVLNAVVEARAVAAPGFHETISAWLWILALELPAVILGLYLLRGIRREEAG